MAENGDNRTEAPTPRRRSEAREQGQVAKSIDLTAALVLMGALLSLSWFGPATLGALLRLVARMLGPTEQTELVTPSLDAEIGPILQTMAAAALPVMAVIAVVSVLSNVLQVGFLLSSHPLEPSLGKLNPITGAGRVFSVRALVQLVMNLLKLGLVCAVAVSVIRKRMPDIAATMECSGWQQVLLFSKLTWDFGLKISAVLLALAVLDYVWQRYRFERDLRMTKEEVREEMRRMEGDPIVKQRRRQLQMKLALQRLRRDVPKANVVVTNPTELAIAIQYKAGEMTAPKVVAKGQGFMAQRIREIAAEHRIPIVERKPLAQALFKTVEVGQEVPQNLYQAVAEILAYVFELAKTGRRRRLSPVPAGL